MLSALDFALATRHQKEINSIEWFVRIDSKLFVVTFIIPSVSCFRIDKYFSFVSLDVLCCVSSRGRHHEFQECKTTNLTAVGILD